MRVVVFAMCLAGPAAVSAQQACQPLQGTPAHATCLNEQLSRTTDPTLRALERDALGAPPPLVAPDLNLSQRDGALPPAYSPDFSAGQAAQRLRLEQSTQSRSRDLSGRINQSLSPQIGAPLY